MTPQRPLVLNCLALCAALAASAPAVAAVRAACTPHPAGGDVPSQAADALSLALDAAHPVALANWDVRWWQRHRVWIALEARNDGDATARVLPQMLVDARPDGGAATLLSGLPLALAPHARATQRLAVYVPDDAKTLGVRVLAGAPVQPVAVAFALECSDARFATGELAPSVTRLLDEALMTYFTGFVDPLPDPNAALETARMLASGAQDGVDVLWTLRGVMQSVRDDHGYIVGPDEPPPVRRAPATRPSEFELRADGTAVVRLHALDTGAPGAAQAWAGALHDGVAALAARHPLAWIVDLRDHDADSPWPAFAGLSTLLDGPAVGAFVDRRGTQPWIVERGSARIAGGPAQVDLESPPEPSLRAAVAVLTGPGTRDAGEDLAVAFRGRANTRFFGAPTAGFPTLGVRAHRLADGSTLGVLETRDADRTGTVHRLGVEPDVPAAADATPEAVLRQAVDWALAERGAVERR